MKTPRIAALTCIIALMALGFTVLVPPAAAVPLDCSWNGGSLLGDVWGAGCRFGVVVCDAAAGSACPVE